MIHFTKSDGADLQKLLDKAKVNDNANVYRSGRVFEQLKADFHRKCYLCEDDEITAIEIEHFHAHRGDPVRKYDWSNLFYSCGHCNGVKSAKYWPLLNCTDQTHKVWDSIEIRLQPSLKVDVEVKLNPGCPKPAEGENTRQLLDKALRGIKATPMQKEQASNLRQKMLRVHNQFWEFIQKKDMAALKKATADDAPFAGMLRWCLKNDFIGIYNELSPHWVRNQQ